MTTQKSKTELLKTIIIIIISALLILGMGVLSYQRYHNYRLKQAQSEVARRLEIDKQAKITADRESKFNADINRLVSICFDAQQRYDSLSKIDQAKTYRPNCELTPR